VGCDLIREYPEQKPHPECMFLGYRGQLDGPCQMVVAGNDETIIVTVYNSDPEVYGVDHRRQRK
jgi:hypothetical protein